MSLSRNTVDKILELTADAIISELEAAKADARKPNWAVLQAALKLVDRVELGPGDEPIIEHPAQITEAQRSSSSLERLQKSGKLGLLPFLEPEERVKYGLPLKPTEDGV
jgi:hypothetical protein